MIREDPRGLHLPEASLDPLRSISEGEAGEHLWWISDGGRECDYTLRFDVFSCTWLLHVLLMHALMTLKILAYIRLHMHFSTHIWILEFLMYILGIFYFWYLEMFTLCTFSCIWIWITTYIHCCNMGCSNWKCFCTFFFLSINAAAWDEQRELKEQMTDEQWMFQFMHTKLKKVPYQHDRKIKKTHKWT